MRVGLPAPDYTQAWARGVHLTAEQAIAYALADMPDDAERTATLHAAPARFVPAVAGKPTDPASIPETPEHLSPRELDVLRIMMTGASNCTIATALMISDATVKTHVAHILQKLGVRSRTMVIARAHTRLRMIPAVEHQGPRRHSSFMMMSPTA